MAIYRQGTDNVRYKKRNVGSSKAGGMKGNM